jgi:hypothetical protein
VSVANTKTRLPGGSFLIYSAHFHVVHPDFADPAGTLSDRREPGHREKYRTGARELGDSLERDAQRSCKGAAHPTLRQVKTAMKK